MKQKKTVLLVTILLCVLFILTACSDKAHEEAVSSFNSAEKTIQELSENLLAEISSAETIIGAVSADELDDPSLMATLQAVCSEAKEYLEETPIQKVDERETAETINRKIEYLNSIAETIRAKLEAVNTAFNAVNSSRQAKTDRIADEETSDIGKNETTIGNTSILNDSHGPILLDGNDQSFTLYQVDLSTKEIIPVFAFKNPIDPAFVAKTYKYRTSIDLTPDYLPVYLRKQLFSQDMTKFAVNWSDTKDGSYRVGWIDQNGKLTDVSEILHPATSGFTGKVPADSNALFTPDGEFFFYDKNNKTYCYVDVETIQLLREEAPLYRKLLDKQVEINDIVFRWNGKPSSDFSTSNTEDYKEIKVGDATFFIWHKKNKIKAYDVDVGNNVLIGCFTASSSGSCIGMYGNGITEPDQNNKYDGTFIKVTPDTDYTIEACAYYNNKIAFTAYRGDSRSLFIVDAVENGTPVEIMNLPKNKYQLFFWR